MNRPDLRHFLLALLLFTIKPIGTFAQSYSYQWATNTGDALSGTLQVAPGATVTLQVYIVETGGNVLTTDGLFTAGVRARYFDPATSGSNANVLSVANVSAITPNTAFNDSVAYSPAVNNPNYAQFTQAALNPFTDGVKATANRVLLGSIDFQVTGTEGQSTILTALDIPTTASGSVSNDTFTASPSFRELDSVISQANLSIFVSAVPEPILTLLTGSMTILVIRRLSRRQATH